MKIEKIKLTPEQQLFKDTYEKMRVFIAYRKGPALALACKWHLEQIKLLEAQIENLTLELNKNELKQKLQIHRLV